MGALEGMVTRCDLFGNRIAVRAFPPASAILVPRSSVSRAHDHYDYRHVSGTLVLARGASFSDLLVMLMRSRVRISPGYQILKFVAW